MEPQITAAMVARSRVVAEPRWSPDGSLLAWVESFGGRADLVVAPADRSGPPVVVTADPAVTSMGSYGGGAFTWVPDGRLLYASAEGDLALVSSHGGPTRVLAFTGRAAAPAVTGDGSSFAGVRQTEEVCEIVVGSLHGDADVRAVSEADFAFDPSWSPNGRYLAWHEWDVPNMPWDGSRIVVLDLETNECRIVAGGDSIATGQPRFSPDGTALAFVCDASGWMNAWIANADGTGAHSLLAEPHEHAEPSWGPGQRSLAWSPDSTAIALCRNESGFGRLIVAAASAAPRELSRGWHQGLDWGAPGIACVRSGARTPPQVTTIDPISGARQVWARGPVGGFEEAGLAEPEPVEWEGAAGRVFGLLWRPATGDPLPPLLVQIHGGPTGQAVAGWNARAQYFLARGWAVLHPNHRGSTGYGRAYTRALEEGWGEIDVDDTAFGIRHAIEAGWCDPKRVVVMGGSAGGLTVLLLCARHPGLIRAGISAYGVTDLEQLAATTHRFEARYLDRLVGPLPESEEIYRARSPTTVADAMRVPLLILQGSDDKVVPRSQAQSVVAALERSGTPVEYQVYEGEGHGWSKAETVMDELIRIEGFLAQHAGSD